MVCSAVTAGAASSRTDADAGLGGSGRKEVKGCEKAGKTGENEKRQDGPECDARPGCREGR